MMNTTTRDNGHVHSWRDGDRKTDVKYFHSHPINLSRMVAEKGNSKHIHKLLKGMY